MELRLLGPVEAWSHGRPVDLGSRKQRLVAAVLSLEVNRLVPVERLIELSWGERPPPTARTVIQTHIYRLRTAFASVDATPQAVRLTTSGSGYSLVADPMVVDAHRFRALLERARSTVDDERKVALLVGALRLWRGPALAGAAVAETRQRLCGGLDEARTVALEDRFDAELRLGRHRDVLDELTGLVRAHPSRERLVGQLMLALYRSGRAGDALLICRDVRSRLAEDLGIDAGPQIRTLETAILRNDPALSGPPGTAAGATAARVQPDGRPPVPAELPAEAGAFVGREKELAGLDVMLAGAGDQEENPAVVIVAIVGTAGVGKTALAVRWSRRVRGRFPDGQLYVDLRGYATGPPLPPVQALAAFLRALDVPPEKVPTEEPAAASLYRSLLADKRVLVVLDNARDAAQVRPLLPGGPGCVAVVTSRDQLTGLAARDGARRIALDVLRPAEAQALLAGLLTAERIGSQHGAVAELARTCGYLPLALRVAAANLANRPGRGITGYVRELVDGNRLAALSAEGDEEVAVRAAFGLSYRELPDPFRRLFRLLGLVPGPDVTVPAAAALAGTTPARARRSLDRLAAAHLITEHQPGRYGCHDLLRLYAAERAASDDSEADRASAVRRLLDWYLHTVDAAARLLYPEFLRLSLAPPPAPLPGFADPAEAWAWLDAERPNLVAVVRYAASHGPRRTAWLLADALRYYFVLRMHAVDWQAVADAGLAAAEAERDVRAQTAARLNLGNLHHNRGLNQLAIAQYTQALALAEQCGWQEAQAALLGNLGTMYRFVGRLPEAVDHLTQALEFDRRLGRVTGQANHLSNLGQIYHELGRLVRAAEHYSRALAMHRRIGFPGGVSVSLANLGEVHHLLGESGRALGELTEALAIQREMGDRVSEGYTLQCLAVVYRDTGREAEALAYAGDALAAGRDVGAWWTESDSVNLLGTVYHRLGRDSDAIDQHSRALRMAGENHDCRLEAEALIGLADIEHGDAADLARTRADRALAMARRYGYRLLEGAALVRLAAIHQSAGRAHQAGTLARQALAIHRESGHRLGQADALRVLGAALHDSGTTAAALECRQQELAILAQLDDSRAVSGGSHRPIEARAGRPDVP